MFLGIVVLFSASACGCRGRTHRSTPEQDQESPVRPPVPDASDVSLSGLHGAAPASLGSAFEGAALGAGMTLAARQTMQETIQARLGGLGVELAGDQRALHSIVVRVPPSSSGTRTCAALERELAASWGSRDRLGWIDPNERRRAIWWLESPASACELQYESYLPVGAWVDSILAMKMGTPSQALVQASPGRDGLTWKGPGLAGGADGTSWKVAAEQGKVVRLTASALADMPTVSATIDAVTARLGGERKTGSTIPNGIHYHWDGKVQVNLLVVGAPSVMRGVGTISLIVKAPSVGP